MKKLLVIVPAILALLAGGFFLFREAAGWNDGMEHPRSEIHAATLDGKIYVAGGIGLFRVLDSCEVYDTAKKRWQSCAPLPRALHHAAMASDGKRIYASGGYVALPFEQDHEAGLFAYDVARGKWSEIAKLPHPIGQHIMAYHSGRLYLVGGQSGTQDLARVWSYEIAGGEWKNLAAMPTPRHSHAYALDGDKLYITGGRSAKLGSEIDVVELYDIAANSWETLPDMPVGRGGHGAFVRDGRLHVFGGESLSEGKLLPGHDILDLETLRWSAGKPMPQPRHGFAVGDDGAGEVHVIGGGAHVGIRTIYSVTGTLQKIR